MTELGPMPDPTPLEEFVGQAGAILKWVGVVVVGIFLARVLQGNGPFRLFFMAAAFCAATSVWVSGMRFIWNDMTRFGEPEVTEYWFMVFIGALCFTAVPAVTFTAWMVAS